MAKYFKLSELYKSKKADSHGIDNMPPPEAVDNIEALMVKLDKIREAWGSAIIITSGYRCYKLNELVGGSATSHHMCMNGFSAADIKAKNGDNKGLYALIKGMIYNGDITVRQLLNEFPDKQGNPSWIHVSSNINEEYNHNQILVIK